MFVILTLRRLRQENFKLEVFLGYTEFQVSFGFVASPYLKTNKEERETEYDGCKFISQGACKGLSDCPGRMSTAASTGNWESLVGSP